MRPSVVAYHVRTGIVGLNVVTGALDVDPRTAGLAVRFAKSTDELIEALRAACAEGGPVVAAWSFYSLEFPRSADDLALVRRATAGLPVLHVAGGVHATAEPHATLRAGFDLVVVGEGEGTFVEIVAALGEGRDPRALPGTAHLDAQGGLVSHGPGDRRPLDAYPPFNARHGHWNAVEITRGCIYACSFCQTPFAFKARFRHRSVADVRHHVGLMARAGCRFVRFLSPTALSYGTQDETPDLAAVDALLGAVREEAGPGAQVYFGTFPSEVRPEHVTEEALRIIARHASNRTLAIGGQSGSERVLAMTRRGHGVEEVERAVRTAVACGFRPDVDFLLGLPGETPDERRASMRFAEKLVGLGARVHSHAFLPLPGTPLRDAAPEPIEEDVARALARLESRGAAWGQWRKQVVAARSLVLRRPKAGAPQEGQPGCAPSTKLEPQ